MASENEQVPEWIEAFTEELYGRIGGTVGDCPTCCLIAKYAPIAATHRRGAGQDKEVRS